MSLEQSSTIISHKGAWYNEVRMDQKETNSEWDHILAGFNIRSACSKGELTVHELLSKPGFSSINSIFSLRV